MSLQPADTQLVAEIVRVLSEARRAFDGDRSEADAARVLLESGQFDAVERLTAALNGAPAEMPAGADTLAVQVLLTEYCNIVRQLRVSTNTAKATIGSAARVLRRELKTLETHREQVASTLD